MIGSNWNKAKALAMDTILTMVGQPARVTGDSYPEHWTRNKPSIPELATVTGLSERFIRSLRGYNVRIERGVEHFDNRETKGVLSVLSAMGVSLAEFERYAAVYSSHNKSATK